MKPINNVVRVLVFAVAASLLAACGGGGGGGGGGTENNPPGSNEPPPANPPSNPPVEPPANPPAGTNLKLVVGSTSVSAQGFTTQTDVTTTIPISIENMTPSSTVYLSGTYSGNAIRNARLEVSGATASLVVTFRDPGWDPGLLEPGNYSDVITVRACLESPCNTHIQGSPLAITVSYTVIELPVLVTFNSNNVSVTGDNITWHAPIEDESARFTVENAYPRMWARDTTTGNGAVVTNANIDFTAWPLRTQGLLQLTLRPPSTLRAGTYTDTVMVEFCLNLGCTKQAATGPITIAVTYQVTGSAIPTITVSWSVSSVTGASMVTSETRAPKMTLTLIPSEAVHEGVFVRHNNSATGLIANVVELSYAHGSQTDTTLGKYEIVLKPPAALGSGVFTDTMEFEACFDPGCATPVPNSKHTVSLNLLVTATEGLEFTRRSPVGISGATDVAWSQANQLLYLIRNFGTEHRIVQLDPVTLANSAGPLLEVGAAQQLLRGIAVAQDGTYLYTGSGYNPLVYRLQLPSLIPDLQIPLGSIGSSPNLVSDLATLPGQPQSIVVAKVANNSHQGIFVYDNATARPDFVPTNPSQAFESPRWLVPAATAGTFITQSYGLSFPKVNNLDQVTVGANGITTTGSSPTGHQFFFPRPARGGTKLFTNTGKVMDATSGAIIGTLPGFGSETAYAMVADEAHGRLFVWLPVNQKNMVLSYDLATLQLLAYAPVFGGSVGTSSVNGRSMALWGADGVALVDSSGGVTLLSGPFFTTYRGAPTQ